MPPITKQDENESLIAWLSKQNKDSARGVYHTDCTNELQRSEYGTYSVHRYTIRDDNYGRKFQVHLMTDFAYLVGLIHHNVGSTQWKATCWLNLIDDLTLTIGQARGG